MYEEFFGLTEKPFSIQPDPSFLYWGRAHRLAYAMLEYGVLNHAGISIVTGEVGCGKTTLIHRLLDQLSDTHAVALLSNIQEGRGDLLSWVLMGFGQPFSGKTHVELFSQVQNFFISEYAKGRRVVLIIDEAQNLSIDMLEELRMLSNINAGKDQLLQLILVGQPELKDVLNRPDMLQLAQRVGSDFHLTPLSPEEVDAYIETRMMIAGSQKRVFSEKAVELIAEQSRGVPRVINIIADTALVYAYSAQSDVVDVHTIRDVVRDKLSYGVFGLAAEPTVPAPPGDASGPTPFIKEKTDRSTARVKPELREVPPVASPDPAPEPDAPRMPPPSRRTRVSGSEAPAANFDEPANAPEPVRPRFEPIPSPRRAPFVSEAPGLSAEKEPRHDDAPQPTPAPSPKRAPIGVVVIGAGGPPEPTIRSVGEGRTVVFVAQSTDEKAVAAARRAGAEVIEIADRALSPGRARNAGYRQLKKRMPDLGYVQFIEAGFTLDPNWLASAERFMERRPEVAALEGAVGERFEKRSAYNAAEAVFAHGEDGEIQAASSVVLVRADAFESAGGFRGDLPVNETRDLCIRLRRRGAHIWRTEEPMGLRDSNLPSFGRWWSRAFERGYEYAHGAALHGAPPEHLFSKEQARAVFWGAVLPVFFLLFAGLAGLAAWRYPVYVDWRVATAAVLGFGAFVYLLRMIVVAFLRGPGKGRSWSYAFLSTLGHVPEFFGAWGYHFGGARARQSRRPS